MATRKSPAKRVTAARKNIDNATETVDALLKVVEVVEVLAKTPKPVIDWSSRLKSSGRIPNPADRLGQRGLERRLSGIRQAIEAAVPAESDGRAELLAEVTSLESALTAAAALPLLRRRSAHARIDDRLDMMEKSLIARILPGP